MGQTVLYLNGERFSTLPLSTAAWYSKNSFDNSINFDYFNEYYENKDKSKQLSLSKKNEYINPEENPEIVRKIVRGLHNAAPGKNNATLIKRKYGIGESNWKEILEYANLLSVELVLDYTQRFTIDRIYCDVIDERKYDDIHQFIMEVYYRQARTNIETIWWHLSKEHGHIEFPFFTNIQNMIEEKRNREVLEKQDRKITMAFLLDIFDNVNVFKKFREFIKGYNVELQFIQNSTIETMFEQAKKYDYVVIQDTYTHKNIAKKIVANHHDKKIILLDSYQTRCYFADIIVKKDIFDTIYNMRNFCQQIRSI